MIRSGQWYVVLFCCDSAESKDRVWVDMTIGLLSKKLVQVSVSDIEGRDIDSGFLDRDRKPYNLLVIVNR